ncbi:MAG: DUF1858 domain-containing protein [Nanoarchaeota archaeon]
MKITSKTKISKIIEIYPEAIEILFEYGLKCGNCPLAGNHGLEETKKIYGFSNKTIQEILKRVNSLNKKKNEN